MRFIVEYFTGNGLRQIALDAATYREAEQMAAQDAEIGRLEIKCIREIRMDAEKKIS